MDFAHEQAGDVLIVKLAGRLDSAAAAPAEDGFNHVLGGETPRIAIDMTQLDYISSAGLRVLLVVAKKVKQANGKVALFGVVPHVGDVFSFSGFDKIFNICPNAAAALAAVQT